MSARQNSPRRFAPRPGAGLVISLIYPWRFVSKYSEPSFYLSLPLPRNPVTYRKKTSLAVQRGKCKRTNSIRPSYLTLRTICQRAEPGADLVPDPIDRPVDFFDLSGNMRGGSKRIASIDDRQIPFDFPVDLRDPVHDREISFDVLACRYDHLVALDNDMVQIPGHR